ncbi:hypothetical protein IWW54_005663 [Coemansia sp. RSA 2705]|nr:hypothetical protein IWW54_005663 [Coemansia sp. RSA 2705]
MKLAWACRSAAGRLGRSPVVRAGAFGHSSTIGSRRRLFSTSPIQHEADKVPGMTGDASIEVLNDPPLMVELTQILLDSVHSGSALGTLAPDGLPWWAAIAGTSVLLRALLLTPLSIYQQRLLKRQAGLEQILAAWVPTIRSSLELKLQLQKKELAQKQFDKQLRKRIKAKHSKLLMAQGCHPFFSLLLSLCQMPIWMSMSWALRHLSGQPVGWLDGPGATFVPADGMSTEGLLWFTDLTAVDPTMCLPVIIFATSMGNVLLMHWRARRQTLAGNVSTKSLLARGLMAASFVAPFAMALISLQQPSAMVYYWITSSTFGLAQNLVFQIKGVRKALGFPPPKLSNTDIIDRVFSKDK